ncbi:two component transcriptional regulator, LuxR family [Aromatoleum tolulyticum]|uniref:Two component transcriptional regulator, LuxR family n=1 Tax=Aromatoleum tolulyticum TaxID=34027 RepID=A0A1N6SQD1_9RHOO|nr:response regulator transcription factor [Aromatoleum tolulyticum]SIQ43136.1 two component transcriptional regulator, LuxR family [Aromatoleum tolulyticum]
MVATLEGLRLVLADDHTVVRMGFRMLLEGAGAAVVAEAASGEAAFAAFAEHRPDVLVMDVTMPGLGGLGALERLLAHHPGARVLMLSAHDDTQVPTRALKAGAAGYLSKRAQPTELVRAVGEVARGRRYVDPEIASQLALAQFGDGADPVDALTDKEFAVFLQLAKGRDVRQVADSQRVSASTVGTHLYHIKQKLQAANSAQLALIAVRAGLIEA